MSQYSPLEISPADGKNFTVDIFRVNLPWSRVITGGRFGPLSKNHLQRVDDCNHVVDVRSDTFSKPTPAMRKAMFEAEVGDDVYGEDPTVNRLQERVAKLFNKEASLFVTSGTMGNLIAILAHSDRRGCEVIMGDKSHTMLHEQGGPAQIGGVHTRTVPNNADGTFDLDLAESYIRGGDLHSPITSLILVENTHANSGGMVLPMSWLNKLAELGKKHQIPLHMDGARVFNAATYLNLPVAEITANMASVQFCFSKGLGTPIGSMLVGTKDFIAKARRLRKVLGAAMRQVGVVAAPCEVALDVMVGRLGEDHRRARDIAEGIAALRSDFLKVDCANLQTNILVIYFDPLVLNASDFCKRMKQVSNKEAAELKDNASVVLVSMLSQTKARLVVYYEITDQDVQYIIHKVRFIVDEVGASRN